MSRETRIAHEFDGESLESVLVTRRDGQTRPGVVIFPTVMGVSGLELGFAADLVHLGYSGFVADIYGKRFKGQPREAMRAEMDRLRSDRGALRRRLLAVVEVARAQEAVETGSVVAIGYCFGGQCALDLARSGADVAGVASFHGLLDPPGLPPRPVKAKVLVFHGWDDPLARPESLVALGEELTEAGADWQVHALGGVGHAFTNPKADGSTPGMKHDALAAERSWTAFISFLEELFG